MNCIIAAGCKAAIERPKEVEVYFAATSSINPVSVKTLFTFIQESARKYPFGIFFCLVQQKFVSVEKYEIFSLF